MITSSIEIDGGALADQIVYDIGSGADVAVIDGGPDDDTVTINSNTQSFTVRDASGHVLYSQGTGGSVITVLNVEHGTIIGDDGKPVYAW